VLELPQLADLMSVSWWKVF